MFRSHRCLCHALRLTLFVAAAAPAAVLAQAEGAASEPASPAVSAETAARPDPSRDGRVVTLLNQQAAATRRLSDTQIGNVQGRLQALHGGDPVSCPSQAAAPAPSAAASTAAPGNMAIGAEPTAPTQASLPLASCQRSSLATAWTAGALDVGSTAQIAGGNGFGFHSRGVTFGIDRRIADDINLGFGFGLAHEQADASGDGTSNAADAASATAYFSYRPWRAFFVDAIAGRGGLKMRSSRRLDERGIAAGDRAAAEQFSSVAAGYRLAIGGADFAPYTRIDSYRATLLGYADSDGGANALRFERQSVPSLKVAVGVEGSSRIETPLGYLSPRGKLEMRREFEGLGTASISYADDSAAQSYATEATALSRNTLSLGLGATLATRDRWSIDAGYALDYSSTARLSRVDLKVSWQLP